VGLRCYEEYCARQEVCRRYEGYWFEVGDRTLPFAFSVFFLPVFCGMGGADIFCGQVVCK